MPVLKNHTALSIARGVKAFLTVEAGITRSGEPGRGPPARQGKRRTESPGVARSASGGVNPENMVWIFGYGGGRSGTTWLSGMLRRLTGNTLWSSPRVGDLFGFFDYKFISDVSGADRERDEHILGHGKKDLWLKSIRLFILDQAAARYPKLTVDRAGGKRLIINDIHGSIGAPVIMDALPESRMILMMRDPRDMMASIIDGLREGSWSHEEHRKGGGNDSANGGSEPPIRERAVNIAQGMESARRAYENHEGPKAVIKYEDLRADAMAAMKNLHAALKLTVEEEELARVVDEHSWENIPADQKGKGKFYRKAAPGGWREDLTPEQIEIIEETFAPVLDEFYPER